jgi:hypothetical protein
VKKKAEIDATAAQRSTEEASHNRSALLAIVIDQQLRAWSAMMRMSPLPFVLQQQAVVAKLILGIMLPSKSRR